MLSPGDVLNGRYRLTQRIAAGGMGEVWRGEDLLLQREIAVKVLLPALMSDSDFITRFRSEARMMAALRHPGVVQVYDYGESAQVGAHRLDFLVMEFIEGTPLSARIQRAGRLSPTETMAAVAQVADALQAAHDAGIIHRDVKPSNLLVRPGGAIVLVDFGVARSTGVTGITGTNVVLGSAHYMAPEQAEGRPVTAVTDVYAVGAVAFSCLTGRPPYVGDNPLAVLAQLVHGDPPVLPPDVPPAVAAVVMRALARDPGQRFPSASALAAAARNAASASSRPGSGQSPSASPGPYPQRPGSPAGRGTGPGFPPGASPSRPAGGFAAGTAGPNGTGASGGAGFPTRIDSPGRPGIPGRPGGAGIPGGAGGTGFPGRPGGAGVPGGPGRPGVPGSPAGPVNGRFPAAPAQRSASGGFPVTGRSPSGSGFAPGAAAVGAPATGGTLGGTTTFGAAAGPSHTAAGHSHTADGTAGRGAAVSGRRRKATVAVAAAAVAALLSGVGILLGTESGRSEAVSGTPDGSRQQVPAGRTSAKPPGKSTGRPKPSPKSRSPKESTPPAGGEPAATETTGPAAPGGPTPGGPATNPYDDPAGLCGDGYQVLDSKQLQTAAGVLRGTVYLLRRDEDETDCVVTVKAGSLDRKTAMSAVLEVEGSAPVVNRGTFQYYAGPVNAPAQDACVRWGGTIGGLTFENGRSNCD